MKHGTVPKGLSLGSAIITLLWALAIPSPALTLEACVAAALENNPDVEEAAHRVAQARAAADEVKAAYYPQLYTAAALARTDNAPQAFMMTLNQRSLDFDTDFNDPGDTENLRLTVGARYLITDGGRRRLDRRMAETGGEAAEARRRAVGNELIYETTRGYYGILQAQALVKVQEERLRSLEENLRVASERFQAGSAVRTDVLNLEVRLAQAREDLIRARNGMELAVAALNTAIGHDMLTSQDVPDLSSPADPPPLPQVTEPDIEDHPDLRARRAMTRRDEMNRSKSKRDYAPSLYAFGTVDWDSDVSTDFEDSYFAGVTAEWDLFTGFSRGAAVRTAEARHRAAQARETSLRNSLLFGFTQARLASEDAHERLGVSAKSVESAEEALRITGERYRQGAADITELLTAQIGLTDTRTRSVTAFYDYLVSLSNLDRARGTLIENYADYVKQ